MGSSEQPKSRTPPPMGGESVAEPAAEPLAESVAEPVAEPIAESRAEPVAEPLAPSAGGVAHDPTALHADGHKWIGRVLDERYQVQRLLGEGGMGAVFVAEQLTLHKPVALKVIRAELAGNGEVAARFAREAMATAQFEHPHVASAIDYGTLPEGGAYFVMQLVRGRALSQLLSGDKALPWRRVCEIGAQVADALSAAKAAGIIHRDLKPDNILIERREDGSDLVKILDFGIAHVAPRSEPAPEGAQAHRALTRVGTVMGTPGYMSPEQSVGDKVDHRTDLYALGVVLWECITGKELWSGPDLTTVVTRQMTEPVPKLREIGIDPTLPAELDELLQRLTARAPAERPEHAAEVRDALRRLAHTTSLAPVALLGRAISTVHPQVSRIVAQYRTHLAPHVTRAVSLYRAQPLRHQVLEAALAAAALIALTALAWPAPAPAEAGKPGAGEPAKPEASMVTQVTEAAKAMVAKAVPEPALPKALEGDVKALLEGETARARRQAADHVLDYRPRDDVFPYLIVIAELESARGCKARKAAIAKMVEAPDRRYLPPLRRLSRSSKSGCGFLSLEDCLSCVRGDINAALDKLEAEP